MLDEIVFVLRIYDSFLRNDSIKGLLVDHDIGLEENHAEVFRIDEDLCLCSLLSETL